MYQPVSKLEKDTTLGAWENRFRSEWTIHGRFKPSLKPQDAAPQLQYKLLSNPSKYTDNYHTLLLLYSYYIVINQLFANELGPHPVDPELICETTNQALSVLMGLSNNRLPKIR